MMARHLAVPAAGLALLFLASFSTVNAVTHSIVNVDANADAGVDSPRLSALPT